jgi:hypothetical protein
MKKKSTISKMLSGCIKNSILVLPALLIQLNPAISQNQVYDDFEGIKVVQYASRNGVLDTLMKNPAPNEVNKSGKCAMYVRNRSQKFDNIKMPLKGTLKDVNLYATYSGVPPRFKMKIYTTAPVGTLVEILLGDKSKNNTYPAGTHSQYQAHTTVSGAWEEIEFLFAQIPEGSETPVDSINQVTVLFNPNSTTADTYYFDEITGPPVMILQQDIAIPDKNKLKKSN